MCSTDNSKLLSECLEFLKTGELLQYIKQQCEFYQRSQEKVFDFILQIDCHQLLDLSSDLGNLVLNHPNDAIDIFSMAVYMTIQKNSFLPKCQRSTQVAARLQLKSLPNLACYQMMSTADLVKFAQHHRLIQYEGVVTGMSTIQKYTKCARFVCRSRNCEGSTGDQFIRRHVPGTHEYQTVRSDFLCKFCGRGLYEDLSRRILADKVVIELIDEEVLKTSKDRFRCEALTAYVRDDLVNQIKIGQRLSLIGLLIFDCSSHRLVLEVNNIVSADYTLEIPARILAGRWSELPESLVALYEDRKSSPWSFGLSLAYSFAGTITPQGTYLPLKLGMLLSLLVLHNQPTRLNMLVIGFEGLIVERLLIHGALFASRRIIHSTGNHLLASVTRDRDYVSSFLEGGSLLLADDGVCILRDLSTCKKSTKEMLLQVLETGSVAVQVHGLPGPGTDAVSEQLPTGVQTTVLPCRCTIWSYLDPQTRKQPFHLEDVLTYSAANDETKLLASMFSLVFVMDVAPGSNTEHMLVDSILMNAMNQSPQPLISDDDFKKFLDFASKLDVTLTFEAQRLIRGYYLASRRVRNSSEMGGLMPRSAVQILTILTEAHARLNLRMEASEYDALMAVQLYEEMLINRTGCSVLNMKVVPHMRDCSMVALIGPERDSWLQEIYQQLKRFLANHAQDVDSLPEE